MKMTNEQFDTYLGAIVGGMTAAQILSYGDVHTALAEHLNNEVIEAWEKDNPLPTFEKQIEPMQEQWLALVKGLIPQIRDDYRASDDRDDDTPGMSLTIGFTPETRDKDASWSYQTGDNSFTGGAYGHPHWAVISLYRDSEPSELVDDICSQLAELISQ